jgi:hypothetical protein
LGFLIRYIWQALLLFTFKISAYDAILLTICFLLTSALFYSAIASNDRLRTSRFFAIKALWAPRNRLFNYINLGSALLVIFSCLSFGMPNVEHQLAAKRSNRFYALTDKAFGPSCTAALKDIKMTEVDGLSRMFEAMTKVMVEAIQTGKVSSPGMWRCLMGLGDREIAGRSASSVLIDLWMISRYDEEWDNSLWGRLERVIGDRLLSGYILQLGAIAVPFLLFWITSFAFQLKLQIDILWMRLWSTELLLVAILAMNYLAILIQKALIWVKTIPDLA